VRIDEIRDEAMEHARERKVEVVAERTRDKDFDDRPDIAPQLVGWRGDHTVALMMPVNGAREIILRAARILAVGFGCDVIAVTTEGWGATDPEKNPVTGKPWEHGEMEDVALNHDGLAKGWITEFLSTTVVNRAGDVTMGLQRFKVDLKTNALGIRRWQLAFDESETGRVVTTSEEAAAGGYIVEELIAYMNEPDVLTEGMTKHPEFQAIAREMVQADETDVDDIRTVADCMLIKTLPRLGYEGAAMLMADDGRRAAIIQESLHNNPYLWDIWRKGEGWESGAEG
jgi:hypothetical protein